MILRLAIVVQYQLVPDRLTDRQTDGRTRDYTIYRASTASRGNKYRFHFTLVSAERWLWPIPSEAKRVPVFILQLFQFSTWRAVTLDNGNAESSLTSSMCDITWHITTDHGASYRITDDLYRIVVSFVTCRCDVIGRWGDDVNVSIHGNVACTALRLCRVVSSHKLRYFYTTQ